MARRARAGRWGLVALLPAALALAAAPAPERAAASVAARASASEPAVAAPVVPAVSPLVAASRAARAAQAETAHRKVWTLEDLEALARQRPANFNVVSLPTPTALPAQAAATPTRRPMGVAERYRELLGEADTEIEKLQREKLAVTNPLLRGLAPANPRQPGQIEADLVKWRERRRVAAHFSGQD